jgi:hypothetical protein
MAISFLPKLSRLPSNLSEGSVQIELGEGIPAFRAAKAVQDRIELLVAKQQDDRLSASELQELDCYAEIDDYLSFVNRTVRNLAIDQNQQAS